MNSKFHLERYTYVFKSYINMSLCHGHYRYLLETVYFIKVVVNVKIKYVLTFEYNIFLTFKICIVEKLLLVLYYNICVPIVTYI